MAKLIYVEASPRKDRSKSIKIANEFLSAYKSANPSDTVETVDLWNISLPEFDGFTIDAKYAVMHGQDHSPEQASAWQRVVDVCEHFKSADKYVFSLPMWNFGIPYKLKHYIDVIAQPGQTFSFDPATGYSGLVTGKPIAVVYARGGAYSEGEAQGMDLQKGYLDTVLRFIGFSEIHNILVEPTLSSPEDVAAMESKVIEQARSLASSF